MIAVDELTVVAGGAPRVCAASVAVPAGAVVALVGPNGAGKSTLLRAACGDLPHAHGRVRLHDLPLGSWHPRARARRLAVLPQQPLAAEGLRAREVVELGLELVGHAVCPRAVASALARLGLADRAHQAVETLSGGERQRVHLARVVAQADAADSPLALLLDEPTSAQDPGGTARVLRVLRALAQDGYAVLVVLHDLTSAAAVADTIVLLDRGAVVAAGPPAEVLTASRLSAAYATPLDVHHLPPHDRLVVVPRLSPEIR